MKTVILITILMFWQSTFAQNDQLRHLTLGLGTGYNYLLKDHYSYSLSTDPTASLKSQTLSRGNFVISSVIVFRFGQPEVVSGNPSELVKRDAVNNKVLLRDRLAVNVSINLFDIGSNDVSFNKLIDGGIGLGYHFNSITQLGLFLEVSRYRQMRDHVLASYMDKPIPKGDNYYNALDINDDQLFFDEATASLSLKVIFSLPAREN